MNRQRSNFLLIITANFLAVLYYLSEYHNLRSGRFNPDAYRFYIVVLPFLILFAVLFFRYLARKNKMGVLYSSLSFILQCFAVGNKGRYIPLNGIILSSLLLLFGLIIVVNNRGVKARAKIR